MRAISTSLMLVACLSLVALQVSGLHMHVDDEGFAGTPQGTHVHGSYSHDSAGHHYGTPVPHDHRTGQGHSSDTDVSIVNYNTGVLKLPLDLIALAVVLLIFLRPVEKLAPVTVVPRPRKRYERWRPPGRAPPMPIS